MSSDGRLLSTTPLLLCLLLLFLLQRELNLPFSSLNWFHVSLNYKRVSVLVGEVSLTTRVMFPGNYCLSAAETVL